MIVGFETLNINSEEKFRTELVKYFTKQPNLTHSQEGSYLKSSYI